MDKASKPILEKPVKSKKKLSVHEANSLELQRWLKLWRLDEHEDQLRKLGAVLPVDILDIETSHLKILSLKPLELKRWEVAVAELKADKARGALNGVIQTDATKTTPAELFEDPYVFEVFDSITNIVGPPAEASVTQFESGFEATLETAFDAASGMATVISETFGGDGIEVFDAEEENIINEASETSS